MLLLFHVLFHQPFYHRLIKDGCQIGLPAVFEADPALIGHGIAAARRPPGQSQ